MFFLFRIYFHLGLYRKNLPKWLTVVAINRRGCVRPVHFSARKWMRSWHDVERPKHKAASDPTARRGMK